MNDSLETFAACRPVDMMAFIGQWPSRLQTHADAETLISMADRWCLSRLCVSHIASIFGHDTRSGNEKLLDECARDERLLPFPIINPTERNWEDELRWCLQSSIKGIRLVPGYHAYGMRDERVGSLFDFIKSHNLSVQICARLEDERLHNRFTEAKPIPLHEIAEVVVALEGHPLHVSGLRTAEWETVQRFIPEGTDTSHAFYDLWYCNAPLAAIAHLCNLGGASSFAYGSCTPVQTAMATAFQLDRASIAETERFALCRGNAQRFMSHY